MRGSWELGKEENRETRRINRHIARQIRRETRHAMDERQDIEDSRVELTEFVKGARHGPGMITQ
jgi:hypothetical protein